MIPDEDLKRDLERVVEKLGKIPTKTEYNKHGRYASDTISYRFGNEQWLIALENLGYDISKRKTFDTTTTNRITKQDVQEDLEQITNEVGNPPTVKEYNEHGAYYYRTVADTFGDGSWVNTLEHFGYDISNRRVPSRTEVTKEDVRRDLEGLLITIGDIPTRAEYENCGKYNVVTVIKKLRKSNHQSWYRMLEEIEFNVENTHYRGQQTTVQDAIKDLQKINEINETMLSSTDYRNHGTYPMSTIQTTLGETQWHEILKKADIFNPDEHPYSP